LHNVLFITEETSFDFKPMSLQLGLLFYKKAIVKKAVKDSRKARGIGLAETPVQSEISVLQSSKQTVCQASTPI
jgi:hypothetical protein